MATSDNGEDSGQARTSRRVRVVRGESGTLRHRVAAPRGRSASNTPGASRRPTGRASRLRALWRWVRVFGALALVLAAYYLLPDDYADTSAVVWRTTVFAGCVLALAALIVHLALRSRGARADRAEGLLLAVLVSLAFFATVYHRIATGSPSQFSGLHTRTDALYFTLVSAGTVGYGDIHAVGQSARVVVMVQIVFDLVFIGLGLSTAAGRIRRRHPAENRH